MARQKKEFFRGNESLKAENFKEYVSAEEYKRRVREIARCRNDITYFSDNYYTIIAPKLGKHVIKTFPKQRELLRFFQENDRICCLSARQTGKTTSMAIFALHTALFNNDKFIFFAANRLKTSKTFIKRVKLAYELLPNWLKSGIVKWDVTTIEFSNGSIIEGDATSSDSGRSSSAEILLIDEGAFIPNFEEFWGSVYPIISAEQGTKVIICSTPNGTGNLFYEFYESARLGTSEDGWKQFTMNWYDKPGRDEKWLAKTKASMRNQVLFAQNFLNVFTGSSYTLFKAEDIEKFKKTVLASDYAEPKEIEIRNSIHKYNVWHAPVKGRTYLAGADVGDGIGEDDSTVHIFDITEGMNNMFETASFSSNAVSTTEFSYILALMSTRYNNAHIAVEANGLGRALLDNLRNLFNYENIINYGGKRGSGIMSHHQIKAEACRFARDFATNANLRIMDRYLVAELEYFEKMISKLDVYCAKSGKHDDHTMALIWAIFVMQEKIIDNYYMVESYVTTKFGGNLPAKVKNTMTELQTFVDDAVNGSDEYEKIYKNLLNAGGETPVSSVPDMDNMPTDLGYMDIDSENYTGANGETADITEAEGGGPIWIKF